MREISRENARAEVAIVGGGLGGTTLATLLQGSGYGVKIYEQSPQIVKLGFGIDLSANAMRVMFRIGLEDRLPRPGLMPTKRHNRVWDSGEMLYDQPVLDWHRTYGRDLVMTRADLQTALIGGLQPGTIELGKRLQTIDDGGRRPRLTFADGTSAEADFVVGADGVNSRIRELLLGPTPPIFSGVVAFRAAFPTSRLDGLRVADSTKWWGEDRHFIIYYLSGARDIICVISGSREASWDMSISSLPATIDEVRRTYTGFHQEVQLVINAAPEFSKWPLFVHDPLPIWSRGRIVMLGDACHPMRPHMGQGAAMAMEDAVMLVRCLEAESDLGNAFERYRINRIERTSAIQQESQKNTWMKYEMDPGWVYGYDVFAAPLLPLRAEYSHGTRNRS